MLVTRYTIILEGTEYSASCCAVYDNCSTTNNYLMCGKNNEMCC